MPASSRRPAIFETVCPSCWAVRRVQRIGTANVGAQQLPVLQCLTGSCSLTWVPTRSTTPQIAA